MQIYLVAQKYDAYKTFQTWFIVVEHRNLYVVDIDLTLLVDYGLFSAFATLPLKM